MFKKKSNRTRLLAVILAALLVIGTLSLMPYVTRADEPTTDAATEMNVGDGIVESESGEGGDAILPGEDESSITDGTATDTSGTTTTDVDSEAIETTSEGEDLTDQDTAEAAEPTADEEVAVEEAVEDLAEEPALEEMATPTISWTAHIQKIGDTSGSSTGTTVFTLGTTGQSRRVEAISLSLSGIEGGITYRAHVQRIGWQGWVSDGVRAGTSGQSLRVEAMQIKLTGKAAETYDIYYRAHVQSIGWMDWACNGEEAGTAGMSLRVEAFQIVLVPKGGAAPGATDCAYLVLPTLTYQAHVQRVGWQGWMAAGKLAGTTGKSLRVEALRIKLTGGNYSGGITYRGHVQRVGWQSWVSDGALAGTTGQSLRVEAIQIKLTGELAEHFDVWYRTHVQSVGWLGWAKNGATSGSVGVSLRVEAVQIVLRPKGSAAPGSTARPMIDKSVGKVGYQNPSGYYQVSALNVRLCDAAYSYSSTFSYVTPSRIAINANRSACVNAFLARSRDYLGTPYRWNYSCKPGVGVDCIGLVYQCAYATGMNMGTGKGKYDFNPYAHIITGDSGWHSHDSNNFWEYGKALHVSLSSRKPGDLIFWSGHVAIYVGGDEIIEAWPGVGVRYASLWVHGTPRGAVRLYQ